MRCEIIVVKRGAGKRTRCPYRHSLQYSLQQQKQCESSTNAYKGPVARNSFFTKDWKGTEHG